MSDKIRAVAGRSTIELIVIVAGVLIALAVDSWNTSRADREVEAYYLESLAQDLRSDSLWMADLLLPALAQKDSALQLVAPIVRGSDAFLGDTVAFLDAVGLGGRLGTGTGIRLIRSTTFDELVATGSLGLIRTRSLRAAVVAFYSGAESRMVQLLGRVPGYPMAVHAYYPAEARGDEQPRLARDFDVERAVSGLRSDSFAAVMNQEINYMHFLERALNELASDVNELLRSVEAESP